MATTDSKPARKRRGGITPIKTRGGETHYKVRFRKGTYTAAATFSTKAAAVSWLAQHQRMYEAEKTGGDFWRAYQHPVGELFKLYRDNVLPTKAPKTQRDQGKQLDRWEKHLGKDTPLDEIVRDPSKLEAFKTRKRERGTGPLSADSIIGHFRLLNHVFGYGLKLKMVRENPLGGIALPKPTKRSDWLKGGEAAALLEAAKEIGAEVHAYVATCLYAGLRRNEAATLTWGALDLGSQPTIHLSAKTTKTKRERAVPVVPELAAILREWKGGNAVGKLPGALVFPHPGTTDKPYDPRIEYEKARQRAKLPNIRIHDLRHTAGSWLGQSGASAFAIAEVLGHTDVRTTQRYVHLNDEARREAMETAVAKARKRARPTNAGSGGA